MRSEALEVYNTSENPQMHHRLKPQSIGKNWRGLVVYSDYDTSRQLTFPA